ncbi:MAG TPA: GNAT family N-acetyltransferase [Terriglobales bacterium]|jgi:aminoglycoside 6'-N-acetyltransferase I|nr:GNAT family N-acetyltransferase [Terriglobales bacterium]
MMTVRKALAGDRSEMAKMKVALWPDATAEEHAAEFDITLATGKCGSLPLTVLVAEAEDGRLAGFIEVDLRSHADGCDPSIPVGYVEGWFVQKESRKLGVGAALMRAAEDWARTHGCREIASDTWIESTVSQQAHQALGFEVVDRCVHFRKSLS